MAKIFVKLYDEYRLTGNDFATAETGEFRRILFSPDNMHSISLVSLQDGTLLMTDEEDVPFEFSISGHKVLTVIKYRGKKNTVYVNTNWKLDNDGVHSREIHTNPDLLFSKSLNIELQATGVTRFDLKVNKTGFAGCVLSETDLLFMRMNGNHAIPRLLEIIKAPTGVDEVAQFMTEHPLVYEGIGRKYFQKWVQDHE